MDYCSIDIMLHDKVKCSITSIACMNYKWKIILLCKFPLHQPPFFLIFLLNSFISRNEVMIIQSCFSESNNNISMIENKFFKPLHFLKIELHILSRLWMITNRSIKNPRKTTSKINCLEGSFNITSNLYSTRNLSLLHIFYNKVNFGFQIIPITMCMRINNHNNILRFILQLYRQTSKR